MCQVGLGWEASYHSTERLGRDRDTPVCVGGVDCGQGTSTQKRDGERKAGTREMQGRAERERRQEQGSESEGE